MLNLGSRLRSKLVVKCAAFAKRGIIGHTVADKVSFKESLKMKTIFILCLLLADILANRPRRNGDCPSIRDGRYSLRYTFNSSETQSVLEIYGANYRKYLDKKIIDSGKVNALGKCLYLFKSDVYRYVDTSGLEELISRSFGPSCIEITGMNADTTFLEQPIRAIYTLHKMKVSSLKSSTAYNMGNRCTTPISSK